MKGTTLHDALSEDLTQAVDCRHLEVNDDCLAAADVAVRADQSRTNGCEQFTVRSLCLVG